jgi:hypothetical protein
MHMMLLMAIEGRQGKVGTGTTFCANGVALQQNSSESGASPHFPL